MQLGPFQILLFDMDGTLLMSQDSIDRTWRQWAERRDLPPDAVAGFLHGRRAVDVIDHFLPGLGPDQRAAEIDWVEMREMQDTSDIREIPGARTFLSALPPERWAIVTSAARRLAFARIAAAGLPVPSVLVSAEDVAIGKPDPSGYRLAAERLGWDIGSSLVFEDAPAGIAAGQASGAQVIVIGDAQTVHEGESVYSAKDYCGLRVIEDGAGLNLVFTDETGPA